MSQPAIRVENLGKQYQLGLREQGYKTFRETVMDFAMAPVRRFRDLSGTSRKAEKFWALKDVSLEIEPGEVVGVIGRNGAGKTTLLKILSRITEPTTGRAEIRGHVGSLLEVGTGFHPELTGRENVFLNGAILGMPRAAINRRFDEIVAFSGVEKFLDTPVKRYSTGMRIRLAFAVAAHLDPEILLVDEVLAVGDAEFQKKCLGKMGEVARGGRTILFVSHNMTSVRCLCPRVLHLRDGSVHAAGAANEVIDDYLRENKTLEGADEIRKMICNLADDPAFKLLDVSVRQGSNTSSLLLNGEPIGIAIHYKVLQETHGLRVYVDLCDGNEEILIRSFDDELEESPSAKVPGEYVSVVEIPANLLAPRQHRLVVGATIHNIRSVMSAGLPLLLNVGMSSQINRGYPDEPIRGKLLPPMEWTTQRLSPFSPSKPTSQTCESPGAR